jgi:hypothetical protein
MEISGALIMIVNQDSSIAGPGGKMFSKLMNIYVSFAIILLGAAALCYGGELIEPTRTLQDAGERWGKLIVFSEPPEVDVFLDGSKVGQTPLWLEKVKEGTHKLQIKDREKEIYVKEGLFKGKRNRPHPLEEIR